MGWGWILIIGLLIGGYFYATAEPSTRDDIQDNIKGTVQSIIKSNQTEFYDNSTELIINGTVYIQKNSIIC